MTFFAIHNVVDYSDIAGGDGQGILTYLSLIYLGDDHLAIYPRFGNVQSIAIECIFASWLVIIGFSNFADDVMVLIFL